MSTTVFFLDDEILLGDIFKEFLQSNDINIEIFSEADEAINACKNNEPDIMFIDYRLPGTTGEEVANTISDNIKKVLVTGELDIHIKYPFKKVVNKPYKLEELKELITTLQ